MTRLDLILNPSVGFSAQHVINARAALPPSRRDNYHAHCQQYVPSLGSIPFKANSTAVEDNCRGFHFMCTSDEASGGSTLHHAAAWSQAEQSKHCAETARSFAHMSSLQDYIARQDPNLTTAFPANANFSHQYQPSSYLVRPFRPRLRV